MAAPPDEESSEPAAEGRVFRFSMMGSIFGRVLDEDTGQPLTGVRVTAEGRGASTTSDAQGRFELTGLVTGNCNLLFALNGYQSVPVTGINVGQEKDSVDVSLRSLHSSDDVVKLEAITVEGEVSRGSAKDLMSERRRADVAIDFLSPSDIAKFAGGDLSEVVFRMPGVSVADGQYAVVRGLSDRFLSTTLQGVKLPSPDPEKQAMQLDLLPSSAIEAVVVSKTFGPEYWAESSGGNMDIRTRTIPTDPLLKVGFGLKFNANALEGGLDYSIRGGSLRERFGFGGRNRLAPGTRDTAWQYVPVRRDSLPLGNRVSLEAAWPLRIGEGQLGLLVSAFSDSSYKTKTGSKQEFFGTRGIKATVGEPPRPGRPQGVPASPGRPSDFETEVIIPRDAETAWIYEESEAENVMGVTVALGYRFSPEHEIKLTEVFVQSGIDVSQISETALETDPGTGLPTHVNNDFVFSGSTANSLFNSYEHFRERNLNVQQLAGEHKFPALGRLRVSWVAQHTSTYQKDSPFVETFYASPLNDLYESYRVLSGNDPPRPLDVTWADNRSTQEAGRIDLQLPLRLWDKEDAVLKFGGAYDSTVRNVIGTADRGRPPSNDTLVDDPNQAIAGYVDNPSIFSNTTTSNVRSKIKAAYVGASIPLFWRLKLVGGARFEDLAFASAGLGQWGAYSSTVFYSRTAGGAGGLLGTTPAGSVDFTGVDPFAGQEWYPTVDLVFTPSEKLTVRLSYSETAGRPSLRELGTFFNRSIESGHLLLGNPALRPADVTNHDVRVEWTPSPFNFFSVSGFRKEIANPIERFLVNTQASAGAKTETWINNPNVADLTGAEFEFRHNFGAWSEKLQNFSLGGNYTWIEASVAEHPVVVTNAATFFQDPTRVRTERRLYDQPEYIANLDLTWAHRRWGTTATIAAYAISDVMSAAGLGAFSFDLFERRHTRLDFIFSQRLNSRLKLSVTAKNLTDPVRGSIYDADYTSEVVVRNSYRIGRDFGLSLTADF